MTKYYLFEKVFIIWLTFKMFIIILLLFIFINYIYKRFLNSFFMGDVLPTDDRFLRKSRALNKYRFYIISSFNRPIPLMVLIFLFLVRLFLFFFLLFFLFAFFFSIHVIIIKFKIINV